MPTTLYNYRAWCNTDQKWVEVWGDVPPTLCPECGETLEQGKITIISHRDTSFETDTTNKLWVHNTPRPLGTTIYFTSIGDDPTDPTSIGGGTEFSYSHSLLGSSPVSIYLDFNTIENETHINDGCIFYKDLNRDIVTFEMVTRYANHVHQSNTNYNICPMGYMVLPAAGNGTIDLPGIVDGTASHDCGLVYMPVDEYGNRPSSFYDADWNSTTHKFENIRPNLSGAGEYNIFLEEYSLGKFCNHIILIGDGEHKFESADTKQIGHGMRFKVTFTTRSPDHTWSAAGHLTLFRKTIT